MNVVRLQSGQPLRDADRWPWLERIRAWIDAQLAAGDGGVVACSALKRAYRDVLVGGHEERVRLVALEVSPSSLAALEQPTEDERPVRVPGEWPLPRAVDEVLRALRAD